MEHSALFYYVVKQYHRVLEKRVDERALAADPDFAISEQWQSRGLPLVREAMADIDRACRERGRPWLLVVFPGREELEMQRDPMRFHEDLRRVGAELDLAILDLKPTYEARGGPALFLPRDTGHPNPQGHRVAAEALFTYLRTQRWSAERLGLPFSPAPASAPTR